MIGRKHDHYRPRESAGYFHRRQPHRGRCVPATRLHQYIVLAYPGYLVQNYSFIFIKGDDVNIFRADQPLKSVHGLLQHGAVAQYRQELLWEALFAKRPEPFPASAGHYNCGNLQLKSAPPPQGVFNMNTQVNVDKLAAK